MPAFILAAALGFALTRAALAQRDRRASAAAFAAEFAALCWDYAPAATAWERCDRCGSTGILPADYADDAVPCGFCEPGQAWTEAHLAVFE